MDNTPNGGSLEERMTRAEKLISHLFESHEYLLDELKTFAASQVLMSGNVQLLGTTLKMHIAHTDERFSETTDKLNALIDLMDRHQQEHREERT